MYGKNEYRNNGAPQRNPAPYMYDDPPMYASMDGDRHVDGCTQCLKYLIVLYNIVFLLAVVGMVGLSIFILVDQSYLSQIMNINWMIIACWMLIVSGSLTFVLCFFGCFGAMKNHQCFLFTYGALLLLMAMSMICAGIVALAMREKLREWRISEMENELKDVYGVNLDNKHNQLVTQGWDKAQEDLHCCGVRDNSWGVYRNSLWYAEQEGIETVDKPYVPKSCCKKDLYDVYVDVSKCQTYFQGPPATVSGPYNEALHYRGCYYAGRDYAFYYTAWLGGLGIGVGVLLLLGVAFSPWLGCRLRRRDRI